MGANRVSPYLIYKNNNTPNMLYNSNVIYPDVFLASFATVCTVGVTQYVKPKNNTTVNKDIGNLKNLSIIPANLNQPLNKRARPFTIKKFTTDK